MSTKSDPGYDLSPYQKGASTPARPKWATTLVIALVVFLAALAGVLLGSVGLAWGFLVAFVIGVIGLIQALLGRKA